MARLWHSGAELDTTTDGEEVTTNSGTVSVTSTNPITGSRSFRTNPSASTGFFRQQIYGSNQNKGGYLRARIRIDTLPGTTIQVLRFSDTANAHLASIRLGSDGTLRLHNAANAQVGSASAALTVGQVYYIELKCDSTNATGTIDARLNGSSFASGNNSSRGSWARILWGAITPNSTCDIYFDDVALNDDQGSNQTSWPGDGRLVRLTPNAAGDANQWLDTAGSAGTTSNWDLVDETNPNDATNFVKSKTANDTDSYNLSASGIGSSDTVNVVTVHARLNNDIADATTAVKVGIKKTLGGTVTEGTAIIPNSTTWQTDDGPSTFKPTLVTYADPDGSAWTQTSLDSAVAQLKISAGGSNYIQVSTLWAYADYTPGAGTAYTQTLSDTLTLSDTFIKQGRKTLSATITHTDSVIKSTGKSAFTETLSLIDTVLKSGGKILSNTLSLTDTLTTARVYLVQLADTLGLTDLISKLTGKINSETITHTDSVVRTGQKVLAETATLTDTVKKSGTRTNSETLNLADTVTKQTRKPFSETTSLTDSLIKTGQKVLSETFGFVDTLISAASGHHYTQILTETLSLADTLIKRISKTFTESLSLLDWIASWFPVSRSRNGSWSLTGRSTDASYDQSSRSSNGSYNPVSRNSDANYNGISRSSDSDWNQTNRES